MSYRDWQRKHPEWPQQFSAVVGRRVRLTECFRTHGGEEFHAGDVLRVENVSCGRLHLLREGDAKYVRMVRRSQVELVTEPYWLSWCSKRNGNDARRPSGVSWQRTKYMHATLDGTRTLCNREIGCLVSEKDRALPLCPVCQRRNSASSQSGTSPKVVVSPCKSRT